ncbi:DUF2975 domain-containing protein [Paeniglutamicibacter antarcticus]|uniref:DUF2975 domain-containing protein n=1 Tax=Arthrobacter terrae TaxID=2935737 RepID=A0A931G8X7_9MICC|nr:DUF2975 domain-containing protein [Arthrobacter terrae]MBG0740639.1 DUF2975 domain-containing protein [Arthrobacter terrae]
MRRGTSFALLTGLLVLLLFSVFVQVRALPAEVQRVTAVFPEVIPIEVPSVVWGVIAIACWQAVALIGLRIVVLARDHKFDPSAYGWLRAIVGCLLLFIVLVVSAFIALNVMGYGTPGVLLGLIGGGLMALIGASSLALFLGTRPFRGNYSHA